MGLEKRLSLSHLSTPRSPTFSFAPTSLFPPPVSNVSSLLVRPETESGRQDSQCRDLGVGLLVENQRADEAGTAWDVHWLPLSTNFYNTLPQFPHFPMPHAVDVRNKGSHLIGFLAEPDVWIVFVRC